MPKLKPDNLLYRCYQLGGAVLLTSLLAGCNSADPAGPAGSRVPLYFDVKGLLDQQVKQLSANSPAVEKHAALRDGAAETVRVPKVKWADELQIFYQADINKAALRGVYKVDSTALPGGLMRRRYTRQGTPPNAPVKELVVVSAGTETRLLEADIEQHNTLFDTHKHVQLVLQQGHLRSYEVRGRQKLIFFDDLPYAVSGQVE
ncbi:hypothetical protein Q5H93_01725 [Hymenobacter sp. ASUV-10]|uniref:Uncharacterized protein n=1 Tax=Hymenobacter aranciens TaxID=3063996 RepID=A0ABT9B8T7_9BACT|nr:hypothetical protein [Hymenobacter sp. ASUV-10]MDO7873432.1 hypothetical protein [Hymenobacter sp. ASUV-10]